MEYGLLLKASPFKGHDIKEINDILDSIPHRLKKYRAGSFIAQSGELVEKLIVVTTGIVKGEMTDYAGRVIKIEDIPAPGTLASAFIFGNRNWFPVNVIAVTDAELLIIDKMDFLKLMMTDSKVLVNFLDMISDRSQFLSEKIKFLNFKTIKGKLAHYILQKAGEEGTEVRLGTTQNDLADFFGVTRPSVARALGELKNEGYLQVKGKLIKILDKDGLVRITSD